MTIHRSLNIKRHEFKTKRITGDNYNISRLKEIGVLNFNNMLWNRSYIQTGKMSLKCDRVSKKMSKKAALAVISRAWLIQS